MPLCFRPAGLRPSTVFLLPLGNCFVFLGRLCISSFSRISSSTRDMDNLVSLLFQVQDKCYEYFTRSRYSHLDSMSVSDAEDMNSNVQISLTVWRILQSAFLIISRVILETVDGEQALNLAFRFVDQVANILFNVRHWGVALWSQETLQDLCSQLLDRDATFFEPIVSRVFELATEMSQDIERLDNRHAGNGRLILLALKASHKHEILFKSLIVLFSERFIHSKSVASLTELFTISFVICDSQLAMWFAPFYDDVLCACLCLMDKMNGTADSGCLRVFTQIYARVIESRMVTDTLSFERRLPKMREFVFTAIQSNLDTVVCLLLFFRNSIYIRRIAHSL